MNILITSAGTRNKVVQYFKKEFNGIGNVIATDIDEEVLKFAKEGVYSDKSLVDLPKKYLDK